MVVFILISGGHFIIQNNIVRLEWHYKQEYLQLECYVQVLKFPVNFRFNKEEKAHCTTPFPSPACFIYDHHGFIHQNLNTNITIYIIPTSHPELLNGRWFCIHGQHNSSVVVDIHVDRIFTGAECSVLAFQSIITAFFVFFLLTLAVLRCTDAFTYKKETTQKRSSLARIAHIISFNWIEKDNVRQVVKIVLCGLLSLLIIFSPLISNQPTKDNYKCIVQYVILGMVLGSLFALVSFTEKESIGVRDSSLDTNDVGRTGHRDAAANDDDTSSSQSIDSCD